MDTTRTARREIAAYLTITYGLALTIASTLPHAGINLLLSVLVPTAAVAILTFTITPKGARRAMWRGIGLTRAGLGVWPAAVALPLVMCGGAYGTALLLGVGRVDVSALTATPGWAVDLGVSMVLGVVIILGEEIGWRGYLLPRFQQLTSQRRAAVATGFAHGCFHLPLILLATTYDTGVSRWIAAPVAVAVITAGGVFYAWIWDRSHSVWAVAVAHNTVNTVFETGATVVVATSGSGVALVAGETGLATLGVVVLTAAVLLRWARVWRSAPRPPAPRPEPELLAAGPA